MKSFNIFCYLIISLLFITACQSESSDSTASGTETTQSTDANGENNANASTTDASTTAKTIRVEGPGNVEIGRLEKKDGEYTIYCGGNKFVSITEGEKKRSYMLNDGSEIYTMKDRGSSFIMEETSTGRVLWQVFPTESGFSLKNDFIVSSVIVRKITDQSAKVIFNNQQITTLNYKNGNHTVGVPQGNILIQGEPYSIAYGIFGATIAVAPPHQMILLAELLDREI